MATTDEATTIGELRERVTVQQFAASVDAAGDPTYVWSDVAVLWARVRGSGGAVATIAGRRTAWEEYQVTIRWQDGISPAQRFLWRGRYLQIQGIAERDERRRLLTLDCRDTGAQAGAAS